MAETRPTTEQVRFVSSFTGEHILDTYLEAAQKGGRNLSDLLDDLFDSSGTFRAGLFEFRVEHPSAMLQVRIGVFGDQTSGWKDTGQYILRDRGLHANGTQYKRLDTVTYAGELYVAKADHTSSTAAPSGTNFFKAVAQPAIGGTDILFTPDATYDIGKSGATRPRDIFTSRDITSGGILAFAAKSVIRSSADGLANLTNAANTGFTRLTFGPETASSPALKTSGADLQVRLGNDSAFANLSVNALTANANITAAATSYFEWSGRSRAYSSADGKVRLTNAAATGFTSLSFGQETGAFPMLKVSGTALEIRLGDDSSYASARLNTLILANATRISDSADGTAIIANNAGTAGALLIGPSANGPRLKYLGANSLGVRNAADTSDANLTVANLSATSINGGQPCTLSDAIALAIAL